MKDEELLRYNRQIMVPAFDIAGQQRLLEATVLIVGLGGLGCPAALYLAAAGVGHLILADDDVVELTNLQRQIAHGEADIGEAKVTSAANSIRRLNSQVRVSCVKERLDDTSLDRLLAEGVTLVVDGCDNFSTRFAVNRACLRHRVPLVSGAAIRSEGQVAVFDSRSENSPCYQCLYAVGDDEQATCSQNGVLAPLVGIVGAVQAMEALKVLADVGDPLTGRLLLLDALGMHWRELRLSRDPACPACGSLK